MTPLYVLVADDEPEIRQLITRWLEHEGHHVTTAADGVEASAISQAKAFDLLVTDMLMPERDGVQLIAEIRKARPTTRVLAMSGGGRVLESTECIRMAAGLGAHAGLMKPFNREQFLGTVEVAMKGSAALTRETK